MNSTVKYGLAAAGVIVAIIGLRTLTAGPTPGSSPSPEPSATASVTAPSSAADVLNGFLEARVAGEGAQQYLNDPEVDIPLLYATTSGAPYERAEFEPVLGIEWPYGYAALKVRLFAGDTVVEQIFFIGPDSALGLGYDPDGFGTDIAPTTEDGQPVAVPHNYFDGEVTLLAGHPWIMSDYGLYPFGRLIPEGPGVRPTTDGGERNGWDEIVLMADPELVGTVCQTGPAPADAAALAESIRSDLGLEATAPVAVSVGGVEGVMMEVMIAAGASVCVNVTETGDWADDPGVLFPVMALMNSTITIAGNGHATGYATGERMRLYLFDVPEGSSLRILAIAIVAPESSFERAVEAAAPVVDSVEFPVP